MMRIVAPSSSWILLLDLEYSVAYTLGAETNAVAL
jgi:hypothetical protein